MTTQNQVGSPQQIQTQIQATTGQVCILFAAFRCHETVKARSVRVIEVLGRMNSYGTYIYVGGSGPAPHLYQLIGIIMNQCSGFLQSLVDMKYRFGRT